MLLACCVLALAGVAGAGTVRVAAVQCPSKMGETAANLRTITNLVQQAAAKGAKIVVLPECAVQGYMDPTTWTSWSKAKGDKHPVHKVAETVPGPSTKLLGALARRLKVYLCVGLIEAGKKGFHNSQVLLGPKGTIVAHHRKRHLWTPGDSGWCTVGDRPIQVVDTEFGRLGMMICYDFHKLPPLLAEKKPDIVLYSVGWYGPNEKKWFSESFPKKAVIPYKFDIVVSNWSSEKPGQKWPGRGHSCIINGKGKVLAMAKSVHGNEIVIAELEVRSYDKMKLPPGVSADTDEVRDATIRAKRTEIPDEPEIDLDKLDKDTDPDARRRHFSVTNTVPRKPTL